MVTGHFRLETKIKAKDRSGHAIPGRQSLVVAKAAYRSGQMLDDERADKTFNYRSRSQELACSEIRLPDRFVGLTTFGSYGLAAKKRTRPSAAESQPKRRWGMERPEAAEECLAAE
jgi:hypothetical protein